MPCTVPMIGCLSRSASSRAFRWPPTRDALPCRSSSAQHVEHGEADRARQRTAAGRREEVPLRGERVGDGAAGDDGAERIPVAGRLRDRHDVGHHALLVKSPEPLAETAVADLHLVGDGEPAARPHRGVHLRQIAVGQRHAAGVAVHGLADEPRGRPARGDQLLDLAHRVDGVPADVRAAVLAAKAVGRLHRVHPVRARGQCIRVVGGRRRHRVGRVRPAVVRLARRRSRRGGRSPPSPAAAPDRLPPNRS